MWGTILGLAGSVIGGPVGGAIGSAIGGAIGGAGGGAQADAGAAQAALGNRIMDYADPFITQGQEANSSLTGFLGMGDNPQDTSNLQSHQRMGANALNSGDNPFAASNFVTGLEPGQQTYDYDRTFGQYDGSNAKQANDRILQSTMQDYSNSVMGGSLSGKAMAGAMDTASLSNARMQGDWTKQQMVSQQNSIQDGRQGIQSDVNFRQQQYNNIDGIAQRGVNAIGAGAGGAQIASNGLATQAQGRSNQYAAWGNAFSNGLSAMGSSFGGGNSFGTGI